MAKAIRAFFALVTSGSVEYDCLDVNTNFFLFLASVVVLVTEALNAQTLTTLNSFSFTNGSHPYHGGLTLGLDGSFYGTTESGGAKGRGAIFKVDSSGTLTTLVSFSGTNGSGPQAGLALGADGTFYGTTYFGGPTNQNNGNGYGTVFKVTTNGVLTTLVSFSNTNGAYPISGLTFGPDGHLYGTTVNGGDTNFYNGIGAGTVFRVKTNGSFTSLISFNNGNGALPAAGLTLGPDGNLFGTTSSGGNTNLFYGQGYGSVFKLTTNGNLTSLVSFASTDGSGPSAVLTLGLDGNFYGTTRNGGSNNSGTVFMITTNSVLTTLFSFVGSNGALPEASLALGADGNFYGTTFQGGIANQGTLFRVSSNGLLTTLVSFGTNNGSWPFANLTLGPDNNFYGTTYYGGSGDYGTVFKLFLPKTLPSIGITTVSNFPVVIWPASSTNFLLETTTNLASGNWVTVSNGIPFVGLMVTNLSGASFFRLH